MKAICTSLLLVVSLISFGQKKRMSMEDKKKYYHEKMEEFKKNPSAYMPMAANGIGATWQNFSGLNSRMGQFPQYNQLKQHMATLQMGWIKERNHVVAAGSIQGGTSVNNLSKKRSGMRFLGITADAGYNVLNNKIAMLYPFVGLGVETYQARFFSDKTNVDFDDLIGTAEGRSSVEPAKFRNTFFNYRVGAGASFKAPMCPSHSIGLVAGYTGSFSKKGWRTNNFQKTANAPEDRVDRFFVSVIFAHQVQMHK